MNYYPFHIGDYLSATRHLSWEEDGAYRRLLDVYYTTEKPLPLELKQVWRLVLATTESQREAVQTVLDEFFERSDAGWINRRADAEIDTMREKQQKQRERANKRWHKPDAEPGSASAMPRHESSDATASKPDANAMPPTPTPTPTPTPISKKEERERSPSGSRLPADWQLPIEWAEWVQNECPSIDPVPASARFRDYWVGVAGAKGRKADWFATWRNWIRRMVDDSGQKTLPLSGAAQPTWATRAGFTDRFEAENAGCYEANASKFRNGKRIEVPA